MKHDEADRVRDTVIAWQRKLIAILVSVLVVAALVAVVGGPASPHALAAVQAFVGGVGP